MKIDFSKHTLYELKTAKDNAWRIKSQLKKEEGDKWWGILKQIKKEFKKRGLNYENNQKDSLRRIALH